MIKNGGTHQLARVMRDMNWQILVEKMNAFDSSF